MKTKLLLVVLILACPSLLWAGGARKLADQELDQVTAAGFSVTVLDKNVNSGTFQFAFDYVTKSGTKLNGQGTMQVSAQEIPTTITQTINGTMTINGENQLKALVNINAVNSIVNVLLNLVININSNVGTITQGNIH